MKTFRTTGTGSEQTISEIESDKIPLYPSEQDLLDDLANLEVGQIVGVIDPAESELIGVLIQKIQALENKTSPDYENAISVSRQDVIDGYSAPNDGWISLYAKADNGSTLGIVKVNDTEIAKFNTEYGSSSVTAGKCFIPINKDDVFTVTNTSSSSFSCLFIPHK